MTDDATSTATQLATLNVQMAALTKTLDAIGRTITSDSERNATEHAQVRKDLTDLKLTLIERYATTAALERVEERGSERHKFAMTRVETVAGRVNALEDIVARQQGVTVGVKALLAAGSGLIVAAAGIAAVVAVVLG